MIKTSQNIDIPRELREVKSILISQPEPKHVKNPYSSLIEDHGVVVDFRQFIQIEPITAKEYRKQRINPADFSAVIFNSRTGIEHFFRLCSELRVSVSSDMKYFCSSEATALYLQKFIEYRKRKVFFPKTGKNNIYDLLNKHKDGNKFLYLYPSCTFDDVTKNDIPDFLKEGEFDYDESAIYQIVCSDLSDLKDIYYDMIVFFTPLGIKSLFQNFTDFEQKLTRIAAFGELTWKTVEEHKLVVDVKAPSKEARSMTNAIDLYLKQVNYSS